MRGKKAKALRKEVNQLDLPDKTYVSLKNGVIRLSVCKRAVYQQAKKEKYVHSVPQQS